MLALYRSLLYLYPSAYRWEFGHEMMDVLAEVQAEIRKRGARERVLCVARERSEEHTSELQSRGHLVCRLLLEKKNNLSLSESATLSSPVAAHEPYPPLFPGK